MLDEVDGWWHRDETIRTILNSGFTGEGAQVPPGRGVGAAASARWRRAGSRRSHRSPWSASSSTRLLPRTLVSRSLVIRMTPARVGEVPEEIFGNRLAVARLHTLSGRIKRWVADNERALSAADPEMPPGVINRIRLVWRPLLAIADQAGGGWRKRARAALAADRGERRDPSLGGAAAARHARRDREYGIEVGDDRAIHTRDAIAHLRARGADLVGFGKSRDSIRDFEVSNLLKPYGLALKTDPDGRARRTNRRGYRLPISRRRSIVIFATPPERPLDR